MSEIAEHKLSLLNVQLNVERTQAGINGGGSRYVISRIEPIDGAVVLMAEIKFQDGAIVDGINGITDEVLIAIVLDRLRGFNAGAFRCAENTRAIDHFEQGLNWLRERTARRQAEGIEGTHQVKPNSI
jgi:hypothetical protein